MTKVDDEISRIITNEGGLVNDPNDKGGRTFEGISERANPEAWTNGQPTDAEVRALYIKKYVQGPGFDKIADDSLQVQLVDFGVTSGPGVAIRKLQQVLGVTADGVLGPQTLGTLGTKDVRTVNNLLAVSRCVMIARIVQKDPSQLKYLACWLDRALQFLV